MEHIGSISPFTWIALASFIFAFVQNYFFRDIENQSTALQVLAIVGVIANLVVIFLILAGFIPEVKG